jgi:hypothetical protein
MEELKTCCTLDEALKLHAIMRMDGDIEVAHNKELADKSERGRR